MLEAFLVPEKTVVSSNGDGPAINIANSDGRIFLLTLRITAVIEQESLDVNVFASGDGERWDAKPISGFPQKFYCEETSLLLKLKARPEINFIRAHWAVNRWGRGTLVPMFEFSLKLQGVPEEILAEVSGRADNIPA